MNAKENASLGLFLSVSGKAARSIVVAIVLFLPGCAIHDAAVSSPETPFYLAYDSETVIRDQSKVATIGASGVDSLIINDVPVTPKNMRSAANKPGSQLTNPLVVDVLPGEYKIQVIARNGTRVGGGDLPLPLIPATHRCEAGHIYRVGGYAIWTHVEENTSTEVAQKIAENRNSAVFENKK